MEITPADIEALRRFNTCELANAIEDFAVRLRNEGYTGPGLRCLLPELPPAVGFAITARVKTAEPPVERRSYLDRTDWWEAVMAVPGPRVAVIADVDVKPRTGAVAGEIHSLILRRLGCAALVTNGAVRDLPALLDAEFPVFAGGVSPSHAYLHMLDFGEPVTVNGLEIATGDLLACDCHGVLSIPRQLAAALPAAAERLRSRERRILDLCRSAEFSIEALKREVEK